MDTVATRLSVKRLHPLFVGEVTGIDLTRPVPREAFRTIWEAFNEHQVLVFRDQAFDDESQIAFSRNFGDLETMIAHPGNEWNPGHISVMTNLGKDGNFLPPDHPAMEHRARNEAWHSDSSFKPVPALASLLAARIVPPIGRQYRLRERASRLRCAAGAAQSRARRGDRHSPHDASGHGERQRLP